MQITLKQLDIELALKMYLASQGVALAGRTFDVEFTAGRKESGLLATIDIGPAEALTQQFVAAVKELPIPEVPQIQIPEDVKTAATPLVSAVPPLVVTQEAPKPQAVAKPNPFAEEPQDTVVVAPPWDQDDIKEPGAPAEVAEPVAEVQEQVIEAPAPAKVVSLFA